MINFTKKQREAIVSKNRSTLILAGAGTGKTTVLTNRVYHLIENGIDPKDIILLTFSRKAASDMVSKLELDNFIKFAGTFHSFGRYLLLKERLFFKDSFKVLDQREQFDFFKESTKKLDIKDKFQKPFFEQIKHIKSNGLFVDELIVNRDNIVERLLKDSYQIYQNELLKNSMVDFEDLLLLPIMEMKKDENLKKRVRESLKHILIDEFQDTSLLQFLFLKEIMGDHCSLFAVGDDDQSIYSFRDAKIENILQFKKGFPDSEIIYLEKNFRSPDKIVKFSQNLISKNSYRHKKRVESALEKDSDIHFKTFLDQESEASSIVTEIINLIKSEKVKIDHIAILFRFNNQIDLYENLFKKVNIPTISSKNTVYRSEYILQLIENLRQFDDIQYWIDQNDPLDNSLKNDLLELEKNFEGEELIDKIGEMLPVQKGSLKLYTIHASKGLEFKTVFIPEINGGIFPAKGDNIEEERRVFYVGVTRASEKLYLSSHKTGKRYGKIEYYEESIFIKDLKNLGYL